MSRKIRILFTIPNFVTAGSGREMFNIMERLDPNVFECYVCVNRPGGNLEKEIRDKGYEIIVQDIEMERLGLTSILKLFRLARFFRSYRFDIWQSFNWSSDFTEALLARLAGAKYVYTKKSMNWQRRAWRLKSFFSNRIAVRNTTMLRTMFSGKQYRDKAVFITGGVNFERFSKPETGYSLRKEYNVHPDEKVVSCIAQLIRIKGQLSLIEAAKEVKNARFFLVGANHDEDYVKKLKSYIAENNLEDKVYLTGPKPNVPDILGQTDVFVLPSNKLGGHEEGCPVALLEAMAAGCACIATNVAGSNDLVQHRETGLLVEPDNPEQLSKAIHQLLENESLRLQLGRAAKEAVQKKYTLEREASDFERMYKQMAFN